jgi:hypothetical protein
MAKSYFLMLDSFGQECKGLKYRICNKNLTLFQRFCNNVAFSLQHRKINKN